MHELKRTTGPHKKPNPGRFFRACMMAVTLPVMAQVGVAQPLLTVERALDMASEFEPLNRELAAKEARARAQTQQAGQWSNPTLELSQERTDAGGARTTERMYMLSQRFDFSGQKGLEASAARARSVGIRHGNEWERLTHRNRVRLGFYATLVEQRRAEALREALERMDEVAMTVSNRRQAGDISGYDQTRVEHERAELKARLDQANAALQQKRETLYALVDTDAQQWGGGLAGELQPPLPEPLAAYMAHLGQRADLRRLEAQAESAEFAGRASARSWVPDPTIGIGFKRVDQPGANGGGLLLSVSVPLPAFNQGQAEAAEASAQLNEAEAKRQRLLKEVHAQVRGLWNRTRSLLDGTRTFEEQALSRSRELTEFAESAYGAGEIGILELLDAYNSHLDARLRAFSMAHEARVASIELHHASGGRGP